jgi:hypothetical protein
MAGDCSASASALRRGVKCQAPYRTSLPDFLTEVPPNLAAEKIFVLAWIFLASGFIFRILHDANSLQAFLVERERGLLMEDATKN